MVRICSAKNCNNTSNTNPKRSFFKFPKDLKRASSWLAICKNEVLQIKLDHICNNYSDFAICDLHFEVCMFTSSTKNRLLRKAVPTICSEIKSPKLDYSENIHIMEQEITVKDEPLEDNNTSPKIPVTKEDYPFDENVLYQEMKHSPIQIKHEENIKSSKETFEHLIYYPTQGFLNHQTFNDAYKSSLSSELRPVNFDWKSDIVLCRTCLVAIDPKKSAPLSDRCHPKKTIKEMIKFCVPNIMLTLSDEDFICNKCLKSVRLSVKFLEDFLQVEKRLNEKNEVKEMEFVEVPTVIFNNDENLTGVQTEPALTPEHTQLDIGQHYIKTSKMIIKRETSSNNKSSETSINITDSSTLLDPREMYSTSKVFTCDYCTNVYRCLYKLENHQRKFHRIESKGGYDCRICHLHFTKLQDMELHWFTHTGYCSRNQKRFPGHKIEHSENCIGEEVNEKSESPVEEILQDPLDTNSNHQVDGHKTAQNEGKRCLCHICGSLRLPSDLKAHLRLHVKSNSFVCDKCPKSFRKFKMLKYHKMYAHERIRSKCKYCGRIMWNYNLLNHYQSRHSKEINYFCKICGEDFIDTSCYKSHLRHHLSMGHVKRPSKRQADTFNKTERKIIAKKHSRAKCEICSLTFSCDRSRDQHKKMHEDPSHSNRCDICLKICESQEELMEHIARHSLLSCSYCDEQFTRRNLLRQHTFECYQKLRSERVGKY